jgi:hypothetical protein
MTGLAALIAQPVATRNLLRAPTIAAAVSSSADPTSTDWASAVPTAWNLLLRCLLAEADLTMGVDCYASIAEIRDYGLQRVEYLSTHTDDLV